MRRPSLASLAILALTLGVGSGALEVGLRASPLRGMGTGDLVVWLLASVGLSTGMLLVVALIGHLVGRRPFGLMLGCLLFVHAALVYRFDFFLNEFLHDPRVWGGLSVIALLSFGLSLAMDELLQRGRVVVSLLALVAGAAGLSLAVVRSTPPPGQARGERPNVLVVTIDTLRADRLEPYGADNPTPTISRLAREGVLFETVVATAPTTEPSHLAIFTGQPPYQSGVVANGTKMGDRPALLWRGLQAAGYRTGGFVSGFPLHSRFGWSQGMTVYDDDFGRVRGLHSLSIVKAWDQVMLPGHTLRERRGDMAVERALGFLDTYKDSSFFLWVHLFDPHAPYEAPGHPFDPPTAGEPLALPYYWPPAHKAITSTDWLVGAYDAEIRYADALVGQLLDRLRFHNLLDSTIVVLTADHGESLTEHGYLFDHGDTLHDPSLLIPLIVRYPGVARAGHRVPCQVSNEDVTPTVLSLLGLAGTPEQKAIPRTGRDLSGPLRGGACTDQPVVSSTVSVRFVDDPPVDYSYRQPDRKLIRTGKDGGQVCHDLQADPGELRDAGCAPELAPRLDALLGQGTKALMPASDQTTNAALEALGYIDPGAE